MNKNLTRTLIATMVGATVLTPVAYGQTATELAQSGENCRALEALSTEQRDRLRPEWIEESRGVIQSRDDAQCRAYYDQASEALGPRGQQMDREAAARIVVTQTDPEVNVQQRAPLISVTQQEPQVRVDQGQPQIIVRQAPPNVRVQVPQPIITIDQPQPEIIVRMSEPNVSVTNPEPQVEVRQQEPEVNVSQPEPQVSVQAAEGAQSQGNQGEANVQLQQQEPQIEVEGTGNRAQVDVQRQEPSIQYEQAEPNIQVEQTGEPEIRFNQSGEPNIRFEDAGASGNQQNRQPAANSGNQQGQQPAGATANQQGQQPAGATTNQQGQQSATGQQTQVDVDRLYLLLRQDGQMEAGQPMPYNVTDVVGRDLRNARGEELGTVDRVVEQSGRQYLVLSEGGFLGMGEREVAIPLDSVSVVEGGLVLRGMTQEDIDALPEFDSANAQRVGNDQRVNIGTP